MGANLHHLGFCFRGEGHAQFLGSSHQVHTCQPEYEKTQNFLKQAADNIAETSYYNQAIFLATRGGM